MLLIGSLVVGVAGRKHHALNPERHHVVEEITYATRIRAIEQRGIRGNPKAAPQGFFHSLQREIVTTLSAYRQVVLLTLAVHVYRKSEVLARLKQIDLLFQQQRIRA